MIGLLRDWLLDPAALLFLVSIAVGLVIIAVCKKRLSSLSEPQAGRGGQSTSTKAGLFSVGTAVAVAIWFVAYGLATAPIIVNPLVNQLENLYASDEQCAPGSHVVLLSGGVDSRARSANDFERMSPATFVRATQASRIVAKEVDSKLIVSGGLMSKVPEARVIARYLTSLGVSEERLILESASKSTYENAVNVAAILSAEKVNGHVRLITSAMHMHRAVKSFEMALKGSDIVICPVSVDFKGLKALQRHGWVPQITSQNKFDLLLHELIALLAYQLKGWI